METIFPDIRGLFQQGNAPCPEALMVQGLKNATIGRIRNWPPDADILVPHTIKHLQGSSRVDAMTSQWYQPNVSHDVRLGQCFTTKGRTGGPDLPCFLLVSDSGRLGDCDISLPGSSGVAHPWGHPPRCLEGRGFLPQT